MSLRLHAIIVLLVSIPKAKANTHSNSERFYECLWVSACISYKWITVSVHESLHRFGLFAMLCYVYVSKHSATATVLYPECSWVYVWGACTAQSIESISLHTIFKVALLVCRYIFVLAVVGVWSCVERRAAVAAASGWLLCLWYAKCDIFSHLLALRLYECVGVRFAHPTLFCVVTTKILFWKSHTTITKTHFSVQRHLKRAL